MNTPPKPKRNKRLLKKSDHVGGAMIEKDSEILDAPKLNRHGLSINDL